MRKIIYITLAFFVMSCSASKTSGGATAEKPSKKLLKGTWQVTNIKFVGDKGLYKANLFDFADSACFNGSEWVFIPNNGSGKFTINSTASQCETSVSRIHWSFYDSGAGTYQFQMKYVDEKGKNLDAANRGYRSNIDQLDAGTMIMRVESTYEGNPFDVVMTFTKISEDITL